MKNLGISIRRNLRMGFQDLMLHRLRSLLTTLGVVCGVGSVIAMLAIGEGAAVQAMDQIRRLGSENILLQAQKPVKDENAGPAGRAGQVNAYGLKYEDAERIRLLGSDLRRVVPARVIRKEGQKGERSAELRVVGTTPEWFAVLPRPLIAGRVLQDSDMAERAPVAVLTETGARRLLATQHAVGDQIRLGRTFFQVVGVVQGLPKGGSMPSPDADTDVYIPLDVCRERFGEMVVMRSAGSRETERVELHEIVVQVRSADRVEPMAAAIEHMLGHFHRRRDFAVQVPLMLLKQARATQRTFNIVLGSIAGISLLVGGIGIMNIMLASVTERTREIGIRRAIGARRWQIILQFLTETVVLSGLGGLIGIGVGVLIPAVIRHTSGMPAQVPLYSLPLSFGISVGIGILFGLYPAARAARLDPIEALRHE